MSAHSVEEIRAAIETVRRIEETERAHPSLLDDPPVKMKVSRRQSDGTYPGEWRWASITAQPYEGYYPPTADEMHDMVQLGLRAMNEKEKAQVLTAYMNGQCIVLSHKYEVNEIQNFLGDMEYLRASYEEGLQDGADYAARVEMMDAIVKGLGRMVYANKHNLLTRIDAYDE